ncbi:MAG TPA: phenylalanine--tRNA ligase beta subunit-related protein [Bacilli bacterium]
MKITILQELLNSLPNFNILAFTMDVKVEDSSITEEAICEYERKIREEYSLSDILNIPLIKEARDGYKALGKDPSRYRLACESLLRRLVKGYGLYRINNVVDTGNILSLAICRSTAVLDLDKIVGDVYIRLGTEADEYYGIGRGLINVNNIPLYCDEISPFGSPTSDTERTMITKDTKRILLFVICFQNTYIEESKAMAIQTFKKYAYAQNIKEIQVIKGK